MEARTPLAAPGEGGREGGGLGKGPGRARRAAPSFPPPPPALGAAAGGAAHAHAAGLSPPRRPGCNSPRRPCRCRGPGARLLGMRVCGGALGVWRRGCPGAGAPGDREALGASRVPAVGPCRRSPTGPGTGVPVLSWEGPGRMQNWQSRVGDVSADALGGIGGCVGPGRERVWQAPFLLRRAPGGPHPQVAALKRAGTCGGGRSRPGTCFTQSRRPESDEGVALGRIQRPRQGASLSGCPGATVTRILGADARRVAGTIPAGAQARPADLWGSQTCLQASLL